MDTTTDSASIDNPGNAVHFPLSQVKAIALIACAVAFLAAGAWLYSNGHHFAGWISLYFLAPLFWHLRRLFFGSRAALTISRDGLTDETPNLGLGFVPWNEIQGIELRKFKNQSFLQLHATNPGDLLARLGWGKRIVAHSNRIWGYDPLLINLSAVEGEPWFIMEMINELRPSSVQSENRAQTTSFPAIPEEPPMAESGIAAVAAKAMLGRMAVVLAAIGSVLYFAPGVSTYFLDVLLLAFSMPGTTVAVVQRSGHLLLVIAGVAGMAWLLMMAGYATKRPATSGEAKRNPD